MDGISWAFKQTIQNLTDMVIREEFCAKVCASFRFFLVSSSEAIKYETKRHESLLAR